MAAVGVKLEIDDELAEKISGLDKETFRLNAQMEKLAVQGRQAGTHSASGCSWNLQPVHLQRLSLRQQHFCLQRCRRRHAGSVCSSVQSCC